MFIPLIKSFYRTLATTVTLLPIILNVYFVGDMVTSLLYIPLLTLALAILFVYFDKRLNELLAPLKQSKVQRDICEKRVNSTFAHTTNT